MISDAIYIFCIVTKRKLAFKIENLKNWANKMRVVRENYVARQQHQFKNYFKFRLDCQEAFLPSIYSRFIISKHAEKTKIMRNTVNNLLLKRSLYFPSKRGVVYSRLVSMVMLQDTTSFMCIFKKFRKFPLK